MFLYKYSFLKKKIPYVFEAFIYTSQHFTF